MSRVIITIEKLRFTGKSLNNKKKMVQRKQACNNKKSQFSNKNE